LSGFHVPPTLRSCRTTPRRPRTTPLSRTRVPEATGTLGVGGWRERTPTLNHVERSASADADLLPETDVARCSPRETALILSVLTRREELRATVASRMRPETPSALPSVLAVRATGPQLWYGEMAS